MTHTARRFETPRFAPVLPRVAAPVVAAPVVAPAAELSADPSGAITVVDEEGRYLFANAAAAALLGRPLAEVKQSFVYDLDLRFADANDWRRYFDWLRQHGDRHFIAWGRATSPECAPVAAAASFLPCGPGYVLTVAKQRASAVHRAVAAAAPDEIPGLFLTLDDSGQIESISGAFVAESGLHPLIHAKPLAAEVFADSPQLLAVLRKALAGNAEQREVAIRGRAFHAMAGHRPNGRGAWCVAMPSGAPGPAPAAVERTRQHTLALCPQHGLRSLAESE